MFHPRIIHVSMTSVRADFAHSDRGSSLGRLTEGEVVYRWDESQISDFSSSYKRERLVLFDGLSAIAKFSFHETTHYSIVLCRGRRRALP